MGYRDSFKSTSETWSQQTLGDQSRHPTNDLLRNRIPEIIPAPTNEFVALTRLAAAPEKEYVAVSEPIRNCRVVAATLPARMTAPDAANKRLATVVAALAPAKASEPPAARSRKPRSSPAAVPDSAYVPPFADNV